MVQGPSWPLTVSAPTDAVTPSELITRVAAAAVATVILRTDNLFPFLSGYQAREPAGGCFSRLCVDHDPVKSSDPWQSLAQHCASARHLGADHSLRSWAG